MLLCVVLALWIGVMHEYTRRTSAKTAKQGGGERQTYDIQPLIWFIAHKNNTVSMIDDKTSHCLSFWFDSRMFMHLIDELMHLVWLAKGIT